MIPLTRLKKDVQFTVEFTQIVNVMKGIAAARFHMLERQLRVFEQYFQVTSSLLSMVDVGQLDHPFTRSRVPGVGAILVTSDAGFLGGLNSQVVAAGLQEAKSGAVLTVIGERGVNLLHELHRDCTAFPGINDASRLSLALAVRDHVVQQVLEGRYGRLLIAYPKALSFTKQEVIVETLLPCPAWIAEGQRRALDDPNVVWESRPAEIVEYVIMQWLGQQLSKIFALCRLAELGARAMHLEGSYQELLRRQKKLKYQYFRARHEVIDRSIREIFAAKVLCGDEDGD